GLVVAGLGFLASHLFLQVPLSVVQVLFTSEAEWAGTQPYPVEKIPEKFTVPGFRVKQILPAIAPESSSVESSPEQVDS
ncbi:MAG: low-complexity tail membrane protein, partial [Coleofasciculus sp. C2-GNP5-27]